MHRETDVLVIGAGGAGMYAAIAAARAGAKTVLLDKNMVGRGGATIMAQMTVAAALAEEEPDSWQGASEGHDRGGSRPVQRDAGADHLSAWPRAHARDGRMGCWLGAQ